MKQRRVKVQPVLGDLQPALIGIDGGDIGHPFAQIVELREGLALAVPGEHADIRGEVEIRAAGERPGVFRIGDGRLHGAPLGIVVVVECVRIAVRIAVERLADIAVDRMLLPAQAPVDPQLRRDLQFVDEIEGDILARIGGIEEIERSLHETVARGDAAIRKGQIDAACIVFRRQQQAVGQIPVVAREIFGVINPARQRVSARAELKGEIVHEAVNLLLDGPDARLDHLLVG